jgi:uncharacterized protein
MLLRSVHALVCPLAAAAALLWPLWVSAQATANPPAPLIAPAAAAPGVPAEPPLPPAAPSAEPAPPPRPVTVALLLPGAATPFARAADIVRQGFFAAHAATHPEVVVQVIEIDDERPAQVLRALQAARERGAQVVVGPLTRAQVNIALQAEVGLPLITLSLPDSDALAAPTLLAFGLSVEQEARMVVQSALTMLAPPPGAPTRLTPRFVLLAGDGSLARRASAAFQAALHEAGERVTVIDTVHRYDALLALGDRVFRLEPEAVFLALDAREAAMVRPRLIQEVPLFATSLVNLGGAEGALLAPELDGVRFVDSPWLLEPDHPAVMVFARPEKALSAELQRLYALGIDAFRLAMLWAAGRTEFALDGVTGELVVNRGLSARVDRRPSFAVFRQGAVQRIDLRTDPLRPGTVR